MKDGMGNTDCMRWIIENCQPDRQLIIVKFENAPNSLISQYAITLSGCSNAEDVIYLPYSV